MIRFLLALLATASLVIAATGDIQSVTVRDEGWTADVAIQGLTTGGMYANGLGSFYTPTGTEKMVLTVVSHSFTAGGVATTKTRTVYGVWPMRKPWPDDDENEETNISGTTTIRVILSDCIYDEDDAGAGNSGTAITATFLSGFYTSAGTPTNATGSPLTVVNNSTVAFYDAIRNWSWPGFQRLTASSKLRALAFHRHGEQYMPVRAVKFSVSDGVNPPNEELVTIPTISSGFGDRVPVVEYVSTTDLTAGLTQGAELTINYTAYPWVGDNALSTSTGAAAPSPLVGPQKGVCDRTGAYGVTYVVVDPVGGSDPAVGSDSGKWRGDGADPGAGSGVTAYATMARAARAGRDYNAARSPARDDVGAVVVYMKAHTAYSTFGATISGGYGTTPKTWIIFMPFPGVDREDVVITGSSGNTDISDRVKFENVTFNISTNNPMSGCLAVWLDRCYVNCPSTGMWNTAGQTVYLTQCDVPQLGQGFKSPSSAVNMTFALIRGCNLNGFNKTIMAYTVIGNSNTLPAAGMSIRDTILGSVAPRSVPIIAFNKFLGLDGTGSFRFYVGTDSANTTGAAIVQNVIENYTAGGGGLASFGSSFYEHNNYIVWHNTIVGQRCYMGYNDSGTVAYYRKGWSMKNNYFDRFANKQDNFNGGASDPPNGNRVGGWQIKFGVGRSGDYYSQNMISIPGNFYAEFPGLSTYQPNTSSSGTAAEAMFVDRRSATPTPPSGGTATPGLGGGNYDLLEGSPLIGRPIINVVGFDIDGMARNSGNTASGAFAGPDAGDINTDPVATITSPTTGASTTSPATLTGTATDAEDGTISANLVWTSSIDGALGTGANIVPSLSVGTHTITATITDSDAGTDFATISLTITAPVPTGTVRTNRFNGQSVIIR